MIDLDALADDHRLLTPDLYGMWVPKGTVAALVRVAQAALRLEAVHALDAGLLERELAEALAPFRGDTA